MLAPRGPFSRKLSCKQSPSRPLHARLSRACRSTYNRLSTTTFAPTAPAASRSRRDARPLSAAARTPITVCSQGPHSLRHPEGSDRTARPKAASRGQPTCEVPHKQPRLSLTLHTTDRLF